MGRLERIKAREVATEERSGRQDESWEEEREVLSMLHSLDAMSDREYVERTLRREMYAIGMGGPMWWKD